MRDIENVICAVVESEQMRQHLIGKLESISEYDIIDLVMNATCSMEKKNELFGLLKAKSDIYAEYAERTEKSLRDFYSGLDEVVTISGYKMSGGKNVKAVTVEGFETAIGAKRYIMENFNDRNDMYFEVCVEKAEGKEKHYILNCNGDLWYEADVNSFLRKSICTFEEDEAKIDIPFEAGDIVKIDMSPFREPFYGVIVEKDDSWVRYAYFRGTVMMNSLRPIAQYRLEKVEVASLNKDDILLFLSSIASSDMYILQKFIKAANILNGLTVDALFDLFGDKQKEISKEWAERVKWLKLKRFDYLKFIDSKTIRTHLEETDYELSERETALVIYESFLPLKEKHEAYNELIQNSLDENVRTILKKRVELEKILLDIFFQKDDAVYVYRYIDEPPYETGEEVFKSYTKCVEDAFKWREDAKYVRIEKKWIVDDEDSSKEAGVLLNKKGEVINVSARGILSDELCEKYWSIIDLWQEPVCIPLPFKRGDILQTIGNGAFVYEPDWDKGYVSGYMQNDSEDEAAIVGVYSISNWLTAEYYTGELKGKNKKLKDISADLKGEMNLVDFIENCRRMK